MGMNLRARAVEVNYQSLVQSRKRLGAGFLRCPAMKEICWRGLIRPYGVRFFLQTQIGKGNLLLLINGISTACAQEMQKGSSRLSVLGSQLDSCRHENRPRIFTDFH
jgi:hypothetical protein